MEVPTRKRVVSVYLSLLIYGLHFVFYGQTSYILVIRILVVGSSRKRRIKILELKVILSKFNIDQVGLEDLQGGGLAGKENK